MSVTALFRGKFGHKSQENQDKHLTAPVHHGHGHDEDEDDDSRGGFSRDPIRRNSRFYRSMRKKRLVAAEREAESKNSCHVTAITRLRLHSSRSSRSSERLLRKARLSHPTATVGSRGQTLDLDRTWE